MKITKTQLRQIIREELLNEASWLPTEFRKKLPSGLVSQVSKKLGWNIEVAYAFCVDLLEDINAHTAAKQVNAVLKKDLDKYRKDFGNIKRNVK